MAKKLFDNATTITNYSFDPLDLAIAGGAVLPDDERGPLDTKCTNQDPLYDERLSQPLNPDSFGSYKVHGIIEDIEIAIREGIPFVLNGRTRVRTARRLNPELVKAGLPPIKVPCRVVRTANALDELAKMIVTNEVRTNDPPLVKLEKAKRLLARSMPVEDVAASFQTTAATVNTWLHYDEHAVAAVKSAVESREIPFTIGMDLARIPQDKQEEALGNLLKQASEGEKVTRATARNTTAEVTGGNPQVSDKKTLKKMIDIVHKLATNEELAAEKRALWKGAEAAWKLVVGDKTLGAIADILEAAKTAPRAKKEKPAKPDKASK